MHYQTRGAPSRPRNDHHTRWEHEMSKGGVPLSVWMLIAGVMAFLVVIAR